MLCVTSSLGREKEFENLAPSVVTGSPSHCLWGTGYLFSQERGERPDRIDANEVREIETWGMTFVTRYTKYHISELLEHCPLVFASVRQQIHLQRKPASLRATQELDDEAKW